MRTSSYLLKLVILTSMIGIFPILTLGWYSYHYSSMSVLRQAEDSNAQVLRQSQLRVEQALKMIDNSTTQILSMPAVTGAFPTSLSISDRELILELYDVIAAIQSYELGIKDVYLYSLEKDWIITNAGMNEYNPPSLKEKLHNYSDFPQGSVWISGSSAPLQGPEGTVDLDNAVLSVKKWPINAVSPRGLIAVVLSPQQLNQWIASDSLPGRIFIMDEDHRVIADSDDAIIGADLTDQAYIQNIVQVSGSEGVIQEEVNGEQVSISFRKSPYNSWTYLSVVPTASITSQARAIGWTSILISVTLLAATVLFATIGSRRMYSPVRRIYHKLLDGKEGQARDEFLAISERIERILSDQSRLRFEMKGQQEQLVELLVRKLLLNEGNGQDLRERLHYYGYEQVEQWNTMRVIQIQIERLNSGRFSEKDLELLLFAVSNIAAELMPAGDRLPPIIVQDAVVVLAGAGALSDQSFKEAVFERSSQVQASVKHYVYLQTSIGISRPFGQWEAAGRAFAESGLALKYRARLGEEAILFIEDVMPDKSKEVIYPRELGEELLSAIQSVDEERAGAALKVLMEALAKQDGNHNDYQLALARLLMDVVRLFQDAGISSQLFKFGESSLLGEFQKLNTAAETQEWFRSHVLIPGIRLLDDRRQAQFDTISQGVIRLIEEAFDTDLTLEKCAMRLNYHPQYIGRVFRQETGINFADYLAQYRLKMAKHWLKETDMTITDIAYRLSYNNPANFIRYFRKMEGMTPGNYRDKLG
ncbi:AraC family transcriptional regulator [Paenibacillus shunpengii]|uniref:AraC family transcriptional regulator n=1 Tax=Paenibacillus shunpengii TaxID=2054424 RepID=A0ABW5SQ55_9BACL